MLENDNSIYQILSHFDSYRRIPCWIYLYLLLKFFQGKVVACDRTYLVVACDPTYLFG